MKPSKFEGGGWYCSAKEGEKYCQFKLDANENVIVPKPKSSYGAQSEALTVIIKKLDALDLRMDASDLRMDAMAELLKGIKGNVKQANAQLNGDF